MGAVHKAERPGFRKSGILWLQPYYPFLFSWNFGYDQHIPASSTQFALPNKARAGHVSNDEARIWWDYFHRREVADQLAAIKLERVECRIAIASLRGTVEQMRNAANTSLQRRTSLTARIAELRAELSRAKAEFQEAECLGVQSVEEVELVKDKPLPLKRNYHSWKPVSLDCRN